MNKRVAGSIYTYVAVAVLFLYLVPTLYSVFKTFIDPTILIEQGIGERTWIVVLRSSKMSLLSAITAVFCGVTCLYNFNYLRTSMRRILILLLMMPLFIPETFSGVVLSRFVSRVTLPKGWVLVSIVETIWVLPFVAIILILRISGIPDNIKKSASDLNISSWNYFFRIFTPLTWKSWVAAGVFAYVLAFNEFTRANYLQSKELFSTYLSGHLYSGGNDDVYLVSTLMTTIGVVLLYYLGKTTILDIKSGKA